MKYFTPERLLALGQLDDERAFLAAHEEWERALTDHKAHWQGIRGRLPTALRRLREAVPLHDARVLDVVEAKGGRVTITLQPQGSAGHRIVLTYAVVEPPRIDREALPDALRSEPLTWLYDEVDVEPTGGPEPVFAHTLLLSNGWEMLLRFRTVTVTRPTSLLVVTTNGGLAAHSSPAGAIGD